MYIIDSFNKYDSFDREHSVYRFKVNGNWYAIKDTVELPMRVDRNDTLDSYFVYETYEDAYEFARTMKQLN